MPRPVRGLCSVPALLAVVAAAAVPAEASFRGEDGRLALTGRFGGCSEIHTFALTSRRERTVFRTCAGSVRSASFSPGGRRLLFASGRLGDPEPRLMTVRADGRRLRRLPIRGADPSWSPDGRHVVYTDRFTGTNVSIWRARRDGSQQRRLAEVGPPLPLDGDASVPRWSPRGRTIAYLAAVRAEGGEIERIELRLADAYSGSFVRVLAPSAEAFDFAPDGRRVVFYEPRACALNVVRTDGSGTGRKVASVCSVHSVAWSPDGSHIAYGVTRLRRPEDEDPWEEVYLVPAAGGSARLVHEVQGDVDESVDGALSWQPRPRTR